MITAKLRMRRTVEALVATVGGGLGRARRAGEEEERWCG
jgi:hypothetical protein